MGLRPSSSSSRSISSAAVAKVISSPAWGGRSRSIIRRSSASASSFVRPWPVPRLRFRPMRRFRRRDPTYQRPYQSWRPSERVWTCRVPMPLLRRRGTRAGDGGPDDDAMGRLYAGDLGFEKRVCLAQNRRTCAPCWIADAGQKAIENGPAADAMVLRWSAGRTRWARLPPNPI